MFEITALLSTVAPGAIRAPAGVTDAPDFSLLLADATIAPDAAEAARQIVAVGGTGLPEEPAREIALVKAPIAPPVAPVGRVIVDPAALDAVVAETAPLASADSDPIALPPAPGEAEPATEISSETGSDEPDPLATNIPSAIAAPPVPLPVPTVAAQPLPQAAAAVAQPSTGREPAAKTAGGTTGCLLRPSPPTATPQLQDQVGTRPATAELAGRSLPQRRNLSVDVAPEPETPGSPPQVTTSPQPAPPSPIAASSEQSVEALASTLRAAVAPGTAPRGRSAPRSESNQAAPIPFAVAPSASDPLTSTPETPALDLSDIGAPRQRPSADRGISQAAPVPVAVTTTLPARPEPIALPAAQAFAGAMFAAEPDRLRPVARSGAAELAMIAGIDLSAPAPSAPAGAINASPAIDTTRSDWIEHMIDRIDMLSATAGTERRETRIRLNPDQLGSVEIAIEREGETTHLRFTADTAATRTLLADAAPRLAEIADARGLRLGQTHVDLGSNTAQSNSQPNHRQPESRPEQNRSPAPATSSVDDPDDPTERLA